MSKASLTPPWVFEYEKEQNDKLAILEKLVKIKRVEAFMESGLASSLDRHQMLEMVNAYEVVLKLIEKAIREKE